MSLHDKNHPIWSLASIALMLIGLGLCLALGYDSDFDSIKDVRTMLIVGMLSATGEVVKRLLAT